MKADFCLFATLLHQLFLIFRLGFGVERKKGREFICLQFGHFLPTLGDEVVGVGTPDFLAVVHGIRRH